MCEMLLTHSELPQLHKVWRALSNILEPEH